MNNNTSNYAYIKTNEFNNATQSHMQTQSPSQLHTQHQVHSQSQPHPAPSVPSHPSSPLAQLKQQQPQLHSQRLQKGLTDLQNEKINSLIERLMVLSENDRNEVFKNAFETLGWNQVIDVIINTYGIDKVNEAINKNIQ